MIANGRAAYDLGPDKFSNVTAPEIRRQHLKGLILVMDDDAVIRHLLHNMLDQLDYASVGTSQGTEALSSYQQAQDSGHPFACVILDLHNSLGKGATETLDHLRLLNPRVRAIICSADVHAPAMQNYGQYGFRGALAKPFGLDDLDRELTHVLGVEAE